MTWIDVFLLVFPPDHLLKIIAPTNQKLRAQEYASITKGGLIKFFGIIILGSRYEFGSRREIWSTASVSRLVKVPNFGAKNGISRKWFHNIWSSIWFIEQSEERTEGVTNMAH